MKLNIEEKLITKAKAENIERFVVGAVILNANNEILLLNRNSDDFMGGIDELPSGKVEKNDNSLFEALKREVFEETNLKIKKFIDYVGHFDYFSKSGKKTRQFNFLVQPYINNVKINPQEHSGYLWTKKEYLRKTKLTSNILSLLEKKKI